MGFLARAGHLLGRLITSFGLGPGPGPSDAVKYKFSEHTCSDVPSFGTSAVAHDFYTTSRVTYVGTSCTTIECYSTVLIGGNGKTSVRISGAYTLAQPSSSLVNVSVEVEGTCARVYGKTGTTLIGKAYSLSKAH